MKYRRVWFSRTCDRSLPGWGEWVEIDNIFTLDDIGKSLSPDGESGLKWSVLGVHAEPGTRLSPDGESGLKYSGAGGGFYI